MQANLVRMHDVSQMTGGSGGGCQIQSFIPSNQMISSFMMTQNTAGALPRVALPPKL
jgi:hypothetical protein